ncbi:MAG TPA: T9SS type A sorting domain-containing protein [Candidatus Kapabacteria bacterium]|nr:T9SS type A sorting domain-containing protein [Candidatus Kapabacteria bacterium]
MVLLRNIFFVAIFLAIANLCSAQWIWKPVYGEDHFSQKGTYTVTAITCTEDKNVTIIGSTYPNGGAFNYHLLLRSEDGGITWDTSDMGLPPFSVKGRFEVLSAADSLHLFAAGDSGIFTRSVDAGKTWTAIKKLTDWDITSISFFDENHGMIVDQGGDIFLTTDGGSNWVKKTTTDSSYLVSCRAFSDGNYYCCDKPRGKFFHSSNYGLSWDSLKIYEPYDHDTLDKQTFGMYFQNSSTGYILGAQSLETHNALNYYALIMKTTNSGLTWRVIVDSCSLYVQTRNSMVILDGTFGIAVGRGLNHIFVTTDNGESWQPDTLLSPYMVSNLNNIIRINNKKAICIEGVHTVLIGEPATAKVVNQLPESVLSVFPNPASSKLTIVSTKLSSEPLRVYNVLGQEVFRHEAGDGETVLDISHLPIGAYSVKVDDRTLQFIKE